MDLVEVMEFQVPGLKFKERSKNLRTWDSRKDREVREGTELKLRNTLKEKNLKPRNTGNQKEEHIQSLAATGRERWQKNEGKKMNAERRERGERRTEFLNHG